MDSAQKAALIKVIEELPEEVIVDVPVVVTESFWSFLSSPQFWMIVVASCSSILMREDFSSLPWNQIVGQILTILGGAAASYGLVNKVSKNLSGTK